MSIKLRIHITKDILKRSNESGFSSNKSPIALAVIDVFPNIGIGDKHIYISLSKEVAFKALLPTIAQEFILVYNGLKYDLRPLLPEFSFEIEIPDEVIQKINIDQITSLLKEHKTLELVKG